MAGKQLPCLGITGHYRVAHIDDGVLDIGVAQPVLHERYIGHPRQADARRSRGVAHENAPWLWAGRPVSHTSALSPNRTDVPRGCHAWR